MRILCLVVACLILTVPINAQNWNAEEQAIVDHIKQCWDAWSEARDQKNPAVWERACPFSEEAAYWITAYGAPFYGLESARRGLGGIQQQFIKHSTWLDLQPMSIEISDNTALVHLYGTFAVEDYEGKMHEQRNEIHTYLPRVYSDAWEASVHKHQP